MYWSWAIKEFCKETFDNLRCCGENEEVQGCICYPCQFNWCWLCLWSRIISQSISWCGYCLVISGGSNTPWPCGLPSSQWPSLPQGRYDTVEKQKTGVRMWLKFEYREGIDDSLKAITCEVYWATLSQTKVPRWQAGKYQQGNKKWMRPWVCPCKRALEIFPIPRPTVSEAIERLRTGEAPCWGTRDHNAYMDQRPWRDKAILTVWIDCVKNPAAGA